MRVRLNTNEDGNKQSFNLKSLDNPDVSWVTDQLVYENIFNIYRMCGRGMTVGNHSVILSKLVAHEPDPARRLALQWYALFHDATEIFINDVPAPVKDWLPTSFRDMESNLLFEIIFQIFTRKSSEFIGKKPIGIRPDIITEVGRLDKMLGELEARGVSDIEIDGNTDHFRDYYIQVLSDVPSSDDLFTWN